MLTRSSRPSWNQYRFPVADAYLTKLEGAAPIRKGDAMVAKPVAVSEEEAMNDQGEEEMMAASKVDADKDIPDGPMRPEEKRRLNWEGKTYLVSPPRPSVGDFLLERY